MNQLPQFFDWRGELGRLLFLVVQKEITGLDFLDLWLNIFFVMAHE